MVLDYLSTEKETIPSELLTNFDSLSISPDKDFFEPYQFYLTMKDFVWSSDEYEKVKKIYTILNLSNLGELNQINNSQDTIILCKIFEQQLGVLQKIFKYNPRKCNSASIFSGYVHANKSKCCIALPADAEHVRVFEKTLIGGFTLVNTRLAFDTDILLNENNEGKVLFDIDIGGKKQIKRVLYKILKMGEDTQYGMAMTKPLPYGCIKKQGTVTSSTKFNKILDTISHDDKIGHFFIVDIKIHDINEKTLLFNKIYPPVFEKNKKVDSYERSSLQLFSIVVRNEEKDKLNSFPYNSKTHSTLKEKKIILLYAEDLHFLVKRAG